MCAGLHPPHSKAKRQEVVGLCCNVARTSEIFEKKLYHFPLIGYSQGDLQQGPLLSTVLGLIHVGPPTPRNRDTNFPTFWCGFFGCFFPECDK
jgi:hypothetical protein